MAAAGPPPSERPSERFSRRFHLPDGSRSASSPWVWRGLFFMSLIALGICLVAAVGHDTLLALAWGIIALAWFGFSMWLWRQHHQLTS